MKVPRFAKLFAFACVLGVRREFVRVGDTDEVADIVDLAPVVEELEAIGRLLVRKSVRGLRDSVSNDTMGTLLRETASVIVVALLECPPERAECAACMRRETPLHTSRSVSDHMSARQTCG